MDLVLNEPTNKEDEMSIGLILLNAALMGSVVLVVAGGIIWAIATQHRDHGVASTGPIFRRRVWSPSRRPTFVPGREPFPRPA